MDKNLVQFRCNLISNKLVKFYCMIKAVATCSSHVPKALRIVFDILPLEAQFFGHQTAECLREDLVIEFNIYLVKEGGVKCAAAL